MPSFATCTLMGHLGRDPETRPTTGEGSVTTLKLAVTRSSKVGGEKREETTWWRVAIWGTRGVQAAKFLRKGSCVIVSGWPLVREYRDQDGATRSSAELVNADWSFAGSSDPAPATTAADPAAVPPATTAPAAASGDDEPPF